ncbi:hypothetical protein [Leptolyngbya sp. PCC 6406]|nr:hypothetical protein [Leptolyngbya sp. PCC 6406]
MVCLGFYNKQHKPLRDLKTVIEEILVLEEKTEGLLKQLVSFENSGV